MILESITGKRSTCFHPYGDSLNPLEYVSVLAKYVECALMYGRCGEEGRVLELQDPSMASSSQVMTEILECIHLGWLCVQEDAAHRPTMSMPMPMPKQEDLQFAICQCQSNLRLQLEGDQSKSCYLQLT
ncbi:hypothetical protein Taro_045943 [Colocasia esculenta]|uniref:Uncharacterized protein n=1 Tax=Colocasia esculenta TaxID=4460 RepID=A0A843WSI4_COLES|nr:hypothetical protein [Colocasia esculenta]